MSVFVLHHAWSSSYIDLCLITMWNTQVQNLWFHEVFKTFRVCVGRLTSQSPKLRLSTLNNCGKIQGSQGPYIMTYKPPFSVDTAPSPLDQVFIGSYFSSQNGAWIGLTEESGLGSGTLHVLRCMRYTNIKCGSLVIYFYEQATYSKSIQARLHKTARPSTPVSTPLSILSSYDITMKSASLVLFTSEICKRVSSQHI